jgi:hypothetical protein
VGFALMVSHNGVDGILISDTKIRQAKAKSTAYQLTDVRGLYLLVKPLYLEPRGKKNRRIV